MTMDPELPRTRPASADVLAELVFLRQRDGLTQRKVRDHCPVLCELPATYHELARRRLDRTDRHVAASELLKCAVSTLLPRTDHSRVVSLTLNVPGEASTLERRRERLQQELYLTPKAYRRLEDEAYTELAGSLVAADRSPCDAETVEALTDVEFDLHVTTSAAQLVQVLTLLTFERRRGVRDRLADILLEQLPKGGAAVQVNALVNAEGSWGAARRLLAAVLLRRWPPVAAVPTTDLLVFSAPSLSDLFLSEVDNVDFQHELVVKTEQQRFQHLSLLAAGRPTDDFWALKGVNLLQFGAQMERIELDDEWHSILGDTDALGIPARG